MQKKHSHHTFRYGEDTMTIGQAINLVRGYHQAELSASALEKIRNNRDVVEKIVHKKEMVYGINTGFGPLCTTLISEEDTKKLQYNLLKSHSVGVGRLVDIEIARLMMILKVHSLSKAYSGVSPDTIKRIIWHIENDVIPCVPEQGSVGASGDLAPLAHLFLPLIGLGTVWYKNEIRPAAEVLSQFSMQPVELGPKEGLALINGTQFMSAYALMILERMQNCLDHADIIAAISLEAMMGSVKSFDEELHTLRPYSGSIYVAERMEIFCIIPKSLNRIVTAHGCRILTLYVAFRRCTELREMHGFI
jgi:histidine ammonia-lyase